MKLAVIFEVLDDQAEEYADVAARLIQHHAFAEQQKIEHWSFDMQMRPTGAIAVEVDDRLRDTVEDARQAVDHDHPWIPGVVFARDEHLKPLLLAFLDSLIR